MKLKHLIQGIPGLQVKGSKEVAITGLTADSNTVAPGNLFIAKKGMTRDGADFIPQAIRSGAAAILATLYNPFLKETQILCSDPGTLEAKLAARYFREPSKELWVCGITGTKGKTTTSYLIWHLLNGLGLQSGLIGTVETILGEKRFPSTLTTHDVIRNQKYLSEMVRFGNRAAVLEVTSHGLEQGRVEEIDFDLGLFTNLTPDHLDYHKTIEAYAAAKKKLFEKAKAGIFNADSPWCEFMRSGLGGKTFGIEQGDIRAKEICLTAKGTSFTVDREKFSTPLMGRYNIYNLLGAISVGLHLGASLSRLSQLFSEIPPIPGRLEQIENDLGFSVFVDFAHSGEALENVLSCLREIAPKRLIVVFGAGGNRDPARRTGKAAAAEKWADLAIVTSDNPRHEDPHEICRQILAGFQHPERVILEIDRKLAINKSIDLARAQDIVLIAGKGHERTQIFGSQTIPFDDCQEAKEALQNRRRSGIIS